MAHKARLATVTLLAAAGLSACGNASSGPAVGSHQRSPGASSSLSAPAAHGRRAGGAGEDRGTGRSGASGSGDPAAGTGSGPTRSQALSLGQADAVPLGIGIAAAERRLGPPASGPSLHDGYRCIYYDMAAHPPSDRFQLCFRADRLIVVASSIG